MSDQDCEVRAGGDIIFRVDDGRPSLDALRAADMPTLLAIRDIIRQVR
jgi:hypothetical protein